MKSSNHTSFLTLVFASLFLISLGMISHDAFADSVTTTIPVSGAYGVAVNSNTNMTYVANGNAYRIQVINGATDTVVANVTTESLPSDYTNGCDTYTIAVNPKTNLIYTNNNACVSWPPSRVPDWLPQTVSVINGTNNQVIKVVTVKTPMYQGEPPQPIAVNPTTNEIYVFVGSQFSNSPAHVAVINGTTNQVTASISLPDYSASDIAVNPQTDTIFVLNGNVIHVINGMTNSIINNISWGKSAEGLGVNPSTSKIYISNRDNSVSVIDGSTYQVMANITNTGYGFVGVNPVTDKVYASNPGGTRVLSVIDGSSNTISSTIAVGSDSYGIGINTNTNKIYVGNSGSSSVSVLDGNVDNASPTVPSALQNLQAIGYDGKVTLSWTAPPSNGGSAITNYNLYRGISPGSEIFFYNIGNVTSYTDDTAPTGQAAYYKLTAVNSVGESLPSSEVSAIPSYAPTAPYDLQAASGNAQIKLSWSPPSSNNGSPITNYNVYRATATLGYTLFARIGNVTSYTDDAVSNQEYFYQVTAVNSGGESPMSNQASATPTETSNGATSGITLNNVQATSGTTSSSNQITLSNFDSGTGGSQLLVVGISTNANNAISVTLNGTPLTKAVSSFNNNDAEFWYLTNPSGTGNIMATFSGATQAVVGAYSFANVNQTTPIPTHVTKHNTTPNSPNISIITKYPNDWVLDLPSIYGGEKLGSPTCTQQWNANVPNAITGASSYAVVPSPATVTCKWTASSADLWDDVAIEIGSYTASGTSTGTMATAPSTPTGLTATPGNAQAALSWTAPSSNGGSAITNYKIYRSTSSGTEAFLTQAGNVTTYTDNTVTNGQTYYYQVTAVNSIGESPKSNEASATPTAPAPTSGDKIIATISMGIQQPDGVAINHNTNKIYVSAIHYNCGCSHNTLPSNKTFVIDGTTDKIIGNVTVGSNPTGVAVNPNTNMVYVANYRSDTVSVLDGATNTVTDTVAVGSEPVDVAVNPNTNRIYSSNWNGYTVSVIDGTTDSVISTIPVASPGGIAVNPNTNKIYVTDGGHGKVDVIDGSTNSVVDTISVGSSYLSYPGGVAVNPNTNKIYVTLGADNALVVIDGNTDAVVSTIPVGKTPSSIAINPGNDMIYVTSAENNTVSLIDGSSNQVIQNMTVGTDPGGIDVNPVTDKIYVANSYGNTVSVIQGHSSGSGSTGGIVLNNVQSTSGTTSSNQITLSNFNTGTGTNHLLLVGISANNNNVASVTFNGTPLTKAVSSFFNNDAELWYLTNPSSTGNIVVTMNGITQAVVGAYSFSGVNQSSPIPTHSTNHNTSAGSPSISVTTKYPNDLVLDLPSIYGGSTLGSPTCTQQWDVHMPNAITGASSSTVVPSPAAVACKWAASSADFWDDVAVELKAN